MVNNENNYTGLIPENLANSRIDKALSEICSLSRSKVQSFITEGFVSLNAKQILDCSYKVKENDEFFLTIPPVAPTDMRPFDIALNIAYEDEDLVIINKQSGLSVHPGAGNYNETLANALISHFGKNLSDIGGDIRPGIVHRLDKDTTGLMVIAKNNFTHAALSEEIASRRLVRKYHALVWGMPKTQEGVIDINITRDPVDRKKMSASEIHGKEAVTHYKVLEIFARGNISLLECTLETGRTHQIRVHMSHIGHSVIGDQTYGHNSRKIIKYFSGTSSDALKNFKRQALHSCYISFTHPVLNKKIELHAELPSDMQHLIAQLK